MGDLKDIKVFLFDLDGTLNLGSTPFAGAVETLKILKNKGKRVCFVTNNSSRSHTDYLNKIKNMGFEVEPEQIITSGMATARYILDNYPNKSAFVLGPECLKREFKDYGIDVKGIGEKADILILAFDTELTYEKLFHATNLISSGSVYIATHPDFVCPSDRGNMPDAGALMALVETTTGGRRPDVIIGKPNGPMADYVFNCCKVRSEEVAFVGDRLYTDVLFALNNGMTAVLVLTGETTADMVMESDIKPDYILKSVNDLRNYA